MSKDKDEVKSIEITFEKEHFMHLTGIYLIKQGITSSIALDNIVQGQGHFDNIYLANKGAAFSKLQIMPDLKAIIDSSSFYFNDVSDIESSIGWMYQRQSVQKIAIWYLHLGQRWRNVPCFFDEAGKTLNLQMDEIAEERAILGV